jgi:RecJ-like exonuclease
MLCDKCDGEGLIEHKESYSVCPICAGRGTVDGPESEQERKQRIEEERGDARREEEIFRKQTEGLDL